MSLKLWTLPKYYIGEAWPEYYVFLSQNRDSNCLDISNFRVALERLGGKSKTVRVIRKNHSFCGWVEWIAIHKDDEIAIKLAEEMQDAIESYCLDDSDWCGLERERAGDYWKSFSNLERISYVKNHRSEFEFSDFADMLGCCRGKILCGIRFRITN